MSTGEGVAAAVPTAVPDPAPDDQPTATAPAAATGRRRGARRAGAPRFWHREHPVFTPLAGFFTGMLLVVVVLGLLGAILDLVLGYDISAHPWVFLVALGVLLAVNLGLVITGGTRRFARYMLLGILATPTVVALTAAVTAYILFSSDS
jgi:hypothetical protein